VIEAVVFDVGGVLLLPSGDRIASVLGDALGLDLDPGACRDGWTRALAAIEIDVYHGREPVVLDDAFLEVARRMLTMLGRESATSLLESRWMEKAGVPQPQREAAAALIRRANRERRSLWSDHVTDGREALDRLASLGVRLAAVSNSDGRVERELEEDGLADTFEVIVDSSVVGAWKPDPRIFGFCLDEMGVEPDQCLYIGDTLTFDVAGAVGAGLQPCHFDRLDLYGPPPAGLLRVTSLAELPGVVSSRAA